MTVDRANYPGVPHDFPIAAIPSAISGAQPKMALIAEGGRFYAPGTSPSEVLEAFELCEDLVSQMLPYCQRKLTAFGGDQEATAKAVLKGLLAKHWCSDAQCVWIMRKTAQTLGWSLPDSALAL